MPNPIKNANSQEEFTAVFNKASEGYYDFSKKEIALYAAFFVFVAAPVSVIGSLFYLKYGEEGNPEFPGYADSQAFRDIVDETGGPAALAINIALGLYAFIESTLLIRLDLLNNKLAKENKRPARTGIVALRLTVASIISASAFIVNFILSDKIFAGNSSPWIITVDVISGLLNAALSFYSGYNLTKVCERLYKMMTCQGTHNDDQAIADFLGQVSNQLRPYFQRNPSAYFAEAHHLLDASLPGSLEIDDRLATDDTLPLIGHLQNPVQGRPAYGQDVVAHRWLNHALLKNVGFACVYAGLQGANAASMVSILMQVADGFASKLGYSSPTATLWAAGLLAAAPTFFLYMYFGHDVVRGLFEKKPEYKHSWGSLLAFQAPEKLLATLAFFISAESTNTLLKLNRDMAKYWSFLTNPLLKGTSMLGGAIGNFTGLLAPVKKTFSALKDYWFLSAEQRHEISVIDNVANYFNFNT